VANATGERRIVVSAQKHGRRFRRLRLFAAATCLAGSIAVPAASAKPTAPSPLLAGRALGGFTTQGWPVVLEIAPGARLVTVAAAGIDMTCMSGQSFSIEDGWTLLDIAPNGRVHATAQIPPSTGQSVSLTGGSHSLAGKLNRKRSTFRGVWQLDLTFKSSDGQTDQCHSGRVAVAARL
jgi:hypothetical protein